MSHLAVTYTLLNTAKRRFIFMARVMIADDSDVIRMFLKDLLKICNHEIVGEATNGAEAVERFNETRPDVLLLDIAMPKKDGVTALEEILSTHPKAKVIMITANDNVKTVMRCSELGATAYIEKPFDLDKLQAAIAVAFEEYTPVSN
ncbi:MAG TPA: response regulator [Nitrosarchaeum sp.]|nr:response regulator [Nitrosarchaeum sp.]